jgi:hypothetical protein
VGVGVAGAGVGASGAAAPVKRRQNEYFKWKNIFCA